MIKQDKIDEIVSVYAESMRLRSDSVLNRYGIVLSGRMIKKYPIRWKKELNNLYAYKALKIEFSRRKEALQSSNQVNMFK